MAESIFQEIKSRIENAEDGTIFLTKDFNDIANEATIRKYLDRLQDSNNIRRILNGVYEKPRYSKLLEENMPADPDMVAKALARNYKWNIAPCADTALNKFELSSQVPASWSYISDGPYRDYQWDNIKISFKHRSNRNISGMSEISIMLIETLKTLGKERVTDSVVESLRERLSVSDKQTLLRETKNTTGWVYEKIKEVCE